MSTATAVKWSFLIFIESNAFCGSYTSRIVTRGSCRFNFCRREKLYPVLSCTNLLSFHRITISYCLEPVAVIMIDGVPTDDGSTRHFTEAPFTLTEAIFSLV